MFRFSRAALAALVITSFAASAIAQQNGSVTQADIQRLENNVFQAGADLSQLRSRDAARAGQLQAELDDLRDEVIYLRVKLRKEGTIVRGEYADVRDRIDGFRTRARNAALAASTPPPAPIAAPPSRTTATTTTTSAQSALEVPAGTELDVRLQNRLNSGTAAVEDRFEGTTIADVVIGGRTLIPAGSLMRGVVTDVQPATRTNRTGRLTVSFDQVTIDGRSFPIRATVTQAIEGEGIRGEAGRIGTGAGAGAIIGGILGGVRGALLGVLIGAGGTIAATEGEEVDLPQGTVLRVRLDSPFQVQR